MKSKTYIGHARRQIEEYELEELLRAAKPRNKVFYLLAADGGLRAAEILNLKERDIHAGRIFIRAGKGNKARWTITTQRITEAIELTEFFSLPRIAYQTLWKTFQADLRRASLPPDLCLHSLRHRFATRLLRNGVNLFDIQNLMGHSSIKTTAVYLHDNPERYDTAKAAIEGRLLNTTSKNVSGALSLPLL